MQEIEAEEDALSKVKLEKKEAIPQTQDISHTRSYESLWGALLFAFLLLFVVASITSIGWGVYSEWKNERNTKALPSIAVLSQQSGEQQNVLSADSVKVAENEQAQRSQKQASADISMAAEKLFVSVLNGGAAKGSAGTLVDFLKKDGYINVTPGNTLKNYAGIIIYYAAGLEKEAETIKVTVIKKYPQVKILPADVKNKETSVSQVTIILGK